MLSIFNSMFRTATKTEWDAPESWKQIEQRKSPSQFKREAEEWRRRAMRDVGHL